MKGNSDKLHLSSTLGSECEDIISTGTGSSLSVYVVLPCEGRNLYRVSPDDPKRNLLFKKILVSFRRLVFESYRFDRTKRMLEQCMEIVLKLQSHRYSWFFERAINGENFDLPPERLYKQAREFWTLRENVRVRRYKTPHEFTKNVRLILSVALNHYKNNSTNSGEDRSNVVHMATVMSEYFEVEFARMKKQIDMDKVY